MSKKIYNYLNVSLTNLFILTIQGKIILCG